jgi:hypothetical protein
MEDAARTAVAVLHDGLGGVAAGVTGRVCAGASRSNPISECFTIVLWYIAAMQPDDLQSGAPITEGNRIYDWERFWVSRTSAVDLSDGGFLTDPRNPFLRSQFPLPSTLPELTRYRALALLGEPGIGKSTTLAADAARIAALPVADGTISVRLDLRAYSSDGLLYRRLFESAEFLRWVNGTSHLVLHLDSLDEALLRIENIANLLASELPNYPTARMSLRIACRTAAWPGATLEPLLHGLWGEEAVGIFELAPLRRRDVEAAASIQGIDPDAFFNELYATDAVPFAIKPLTLNLLFSLFERDGRLPRSTIDLYTRGCLKLCEEANASRRDTRRLGSLNPQQRLRVASRLAAATMLANRYAIWTGSEADGIPEEDVRVSALARGREEGDFPAVDITDEAVREVLDTGLFTSRGGDRMGWAHQGYAEFLAALYLVEKAVEPRNLLRLLLHPAGGLVPQLAVVTSWVASLSKDTRDVLIKAEPLVLLRGDLTGWSAADLAALTASLLIAFEQQGVHDFVPGIGDFYGRLSHPDLAEQLRPYIQDASKNVISRRAAIRIASACKVKELQPELLSLALDAAADPALRAPAVTAVGKVGGDAAIRQLLPLATGGLGPDPQDDIRGNALVILWPRYLSAHDLFADIAHPNEGYVGSYVMFLTRTLPESLSANHLPDALAWAASYIPTASQMGDCRRSLPWY